MSLRETALLTVLVMNAVPVLAAYFRHRYGLAWMATLLAAISMSIFLGVLWRLIDLGPDPAARTWVLAMVVSGVPVLLTGYLFSGVLGRENPLEELKVMGRSFAVLLMAGVVFVIFLENRALVADYEWKSGTGILTLGPLGKAYMTYLLLGAVFVGHKLETAFRLVTGPERTRLHPVVLGQFGVLGFLVYVLTTCLVYSKVEMDTLVAMVVPLTVANLLTAYGFVRGSLADTVVPVSRSVVYSSFTAMGAALFFLSMGIAAQLVTLTGWTPGHVVTISFVFLVVLAAVVFFFSHRFKWAARRFVDRNFYVNRHDYRSHWARVTRLLDPGAGTKGLLEATDSLLRAVFMTDAITIALMDKSNRLYRVRQGKGKGVPEAVLNAGSPICVILRDERCSLLLDRKDKRTEYMSIYKANADWLESTASGAVAPLLSGDELLGIIGLERRGSRDPFTFEDLELLDCTAAQVAAVLRGAQWGHDLADAREMELLSQWSNMLVHDFKNYLSPLRMIVENMKVHSGNPEFLKDAVEDIAGVTDRMETLVKRLAEFRLGLPLADNTVELNHVASGALDSLKIWRHDSLTVETHFEPGVTVKGDAGMLQRVVENLVGNAVDAMEASGTLTVSTERRVVDENGDLESVLTVSDTGKGMEDSFVLERLFRPFATTKKKGLGLGLYQCRSIVESHGGEIRVESRLGRGTSFRIVLPGAGLSLAGAAEEPETPVTAPRRKRWTSAGT